MMAGAGGRGGGGRRQRRQQIVVVGFVVLLVIMGVGVFFNLRIWAQQDAVSFSADDRDSLRRQFERANLEAMDESAEWRMKYDGEAERSRQLQDELLKVKASLAGSTRRFDILQKENIILQKQIESLKQQCNCSILSNLSRG